MARVKRGVTSGRRHKRLLKLTAGHKGGRNNLVKQAHESALHAGAYAFAGRRQRRRDMRALWIVQLGNAVRAEGLSYSKFISGLKTKKIALDRKILAELAVHNPEDFKQIIQEVK
jgi:large subunit ribosomal protein L20